MADGLMLPQKKEEIAVGIRHAIISEPEQKAIIFYSNRLERLIICPKYEGTVESFAWVIPVLAPPKVEIEDHQVFDELITLIAEQSRYKAAAPQTDSSAGKEQVTLLERKLVGDYDVSVLSSRDGRALVRWLDENGYHLPEEANGPIEQYVKEHWTFVACKIHDPNQATAEGLRRGTLAPLKLTFRALKPVYPLRLSSVNPGPFDLVVFLIMPAPKSGTHAVNAIQQPQGIRSALPNMEGEPFIFLEESDRASFPTLAKFAPGTLEVYEAAVNLGDNKVDPKECKADIIWDISVYP